MLGHFRSAVPVDLGRYTQEAVIEDLRALVDHLDIPRAVFGGHSLGGYTSMRFWEKYPSYVAALIVSGTGPGYRNPEARRQWTEESLQRAVDLEAHGLDAKLDARAYGLGAAPADVPVVHTARGVAWIARGVMVEPPLVDPSKFDVPVLAIVGEQDAPFLNSTDYIANKAPDATKVVIRNAGHPAMFEQPDDWNAAVIEFLSAHTLN
jgi:pimeloyl-ACP methyl ester carboxylesterase